MVGDLRDSAERADEFLGRVRLPELAEAATTLDRLGRHELGLAVLDCWSLVAAARRALSRTGPVAAEVARKRGGQA
jgi:hypothetical protein